MTLSAGSRLGPYEILSPLGAGGMGEVYKARDTRLERTVAVKVLPSHMSASAEVRQRFEREAKTISQLSHPHICALYDVGREGETEYLVMELLEGETLSDRLAKGPLPLEQTLRFGQEIADALDKAHRQGIVHRDLKPGNVMLTKSGVKLLDFGLAKAMASPVQPSEATSLPTVMGAAQNLTQEGTILGTFQYMAPEQLEGKEADSRTDIFAFGCVLFEMATGRKAFSGATQASLISAIMKDEPPPVSSVSPLAPAALDRVVRKSLAKDPDDRWQNAADLGSELKWIGEGPGAGMAPPAAIVSRRRRGEGLAWAVAAVAGLSAAALLYARFAHPTPTPGVLRTSILLPDKLRLHVAVISPDGRRVVFSGVDAAGKDQLWIRSLDAYTSVRLPGTENAFLPFWSPDSRFIGFFGDGKVKRVETNGASVISLCDGYGVGGAWAPNGDILFAQPSGPILRLPAGGGKPTPVTRVDSARHETTHRYPFFLPDGRHFLYLASNAAGNARDPANRIWVGSLDGSPARPLIAANYDAQFANGYLFFIRGDLAGTLMAQPFDPARLETTGEPVGVADQIDIYGDFLGAGSYSVARDGTLLYSSVYAQTRLEWLDRNGKSAGTFGESGGYFNFKISPDGSRLVFDLYDPRTNLTQLWVGELARGVQTKLTSGPSNNSGGVWSPDGSRLAFQSDRSHQADIVLRSVGGSGADQPLTDTERQNIPTSWSKDGRFLLYLDRDPAGDRYMQLSAISVESPREAIVVAAKSPNDIFSAQFSPDGRWVAYDRDESGRVEVFVTSFPNGQEKVQISTSGGANPRWVRDGRELLFSTPDGAIMSVEVDASHALKASAPKVLFSLPEGFVNWDVAPDGQRFLVNVPVIRSSSIPLSLVYNWTGSKN
jgi:eukaryotic-like serine/threonine-protein kinase